MILDSSLLFDDKAPITASRPSTNVIDAGVKRDIGIGERDLDLLVQVTTALVGPGGATLQVQWQGSTDNATWNTIIESAAFPVAGVGPGRKFLATNVPRQSPYTEEAQANMFRYFRLNYVVGGGPLTAGAVSATIVLERSDPVAYSKNFSLSS